MINDLRIMIVLNKNVLELGLVNEYIIIYEIFE
jgi:hypothetical protein